MPSNSMHKMSKQARSNNGRTNSNIPTGTPTGRENSSSTSYDNGKIKLLGCPQAADLIRTAYNSNCPKSSATRRINSDGINSIGKVLFVVTTDASCQPRPSPSTTSNDKSTTSNRSTGASSIGGFRHKGGGGRGVDGGRGSTMEECGTTCDGFPRDNTSFGTATRSDRGQGQNNERRNTHNNNNGKHSGVAVVIRRIDCRGRDMDGGEASHRTVGQLTRTNSDRRAATVPMAKGKSLTDAIEVDTDDSDDEMDHPFQRSNNHLHPEISGNSGDKIKIVLASTFLGNSNAAETLAWNVAIETLLRDREACALLKEGNATVLMLSDNTSTIEFYKNHCDLNACQQLFVSTSVASRWRENLTKLIRLTTSSGGSASSAYAASATAFGSSSSSAVASTSSRSSSTVIGIAKVRGLRDGSFAPMGFFDHSAADLLSAIARYEQPIFDQWRQNVPQLSDVDILWLEHSTNKSLPSLTSNGKRKLSVQEMIRSEWGIDLVPLLHDGYSRSIHPVAAVKTPAMASLKRNNKRKHNEKEINRITNHSGPLRENCSFTAAALPAVRADSGKGPARNENRKKPPPSSVNSQTSSAEIVGEAYLDTSTSREEGMTCPMQGVFDWLHAIAWEHGDGYGQILFYKLGGQWKTVNKSGYILVCPHAVNDNFLVLLQEQGAGQFDSYNDTEKKHIRVIRSLKRPTRTTFSETSVASQLNSLRIAENISNKKKRTTDGASTSVSASASGSLSALDRTSSKFREYTGTRQKLGRKNANIEIVDLLDDDQEDLDKQDGGKYKKDNQELSIIDLCDDSSDEEESD
mmetsp:Transcript_4810/g.12218  ORF Transcript_4810/g.12218 Transcript_4810/m.12218 type:complete len:805 (+) Transcript_4810:219-2633(+)